MKSVTLNIGVRVAWWLGPCLATLMLVARLTGWLPTDAALNRIATRAVRSVVR